MSTWEIAVDADDAVEVPAITKLVINLVINVELKN